MSKCFHRGITIQVADVPFHPTEPGVSLRELPLAQEGIGEERLRAPRGRHVWHWFKRRVQKTPLFW